MLYCLAREQTGEITGITAFSSLKRRDAAVSKLRGVLALKLNVPDEAALRWEVHKMCAKDGGTAHYSKPQRRSIAWVDEGIRLQVRIDCDALEAARARLQYERELWGF